MKELKLILMIKQCFFYCIFTEVEIAIPIEYEDYENHLVDQNTFSVVMIAKVLENDYHYAGIDNFRLRMPDIEIEVILKPFSIIECILNI